MLNVSLFLGMPVDESYAKALKEIDPEVFKLFISDQKESYLNQVVTNDIRYIGKFLEETPSVTELELLEKNIYSILNKLLPHYPHESLPLEVFVVSPPLP